MAVTRGTLARSNSRTDLRSVSPGTRIDLDINSFESLKGHEQHTLACELRAGISRERRRQLSDDKENAQCLNCTGCTKCLSINGLCCNTESLEGVGHGFPDSQEEVFKSTPLHLFLRCPFFAIEEDKTHRCESESCSVSNDASYASGASNASDTSHANPSRCVLQALAVEDSGGLSRIERGSPSAGRFPLPAERASESLVHRRFRPTLVVAPRERESRQRRAAKVGNSAIDANSSAAIDAKVRYRSQAAAAQTNSAAPSTSTGGCPLYSISAFT